MPGLVNDVMLGLRLPHPGCECRGENIRDREGSLLVACCLAALPAMNCFSSAMSLCHVPLSWNQSSAV